MTSFAVHKIFVSLLFDPQQMGTEATRGLLVIHLVPAILV